MSSCERNDSHAPRRPPRPLSIARADVDGRAIDELAQPRDAAGVEPLGAFADLDERASGAQHLLDGEPTPAAAARRTQTPRPRSESRGASAAVAVGGADPELANERLEHGVVGQLTAALLQLSFDVDE